MTKEDIIKEFTALKGLGKAKAELLYKQGFTSLEKLKSASIEDLTKIKGITKTSAQDILAQLQAKPTGKKAEKKTKAKPTTPKKKETKEAAPEEPEDVEIVEEEEEGGYQVKKKPKLSKDTKNKLAVRRHIKKRTPEFLREEWFRYKRISKNWRKPDGITSKMRINLKYRPSKVRVGFRGPAEVRGFHPSGFQEILVYNTKDLEKVDPKTQAVRIGGTVGTKKRLAIAKKAEELEIRVLNMKV